MIGGGLGSYIGKFHRWGAMLDDSAELVCGCFSRSMDRNRATAEAYHLPDTSRVYADFREMADKESAREDGIDFVSIMTANDTHYEIAKCFLEHGIHVICDKPLALRTAEAEELARIAEERGLLFGITYSYTGYALIRQAREMIRVIGTEGSLEWTATDRDHLIYTPRSQPSQRLSAGADYLLDASTRLSRVGAGHNEGFIEAFSNIYRSFCNVLSDRKAGRENTTDTFPTVEDGVLGVRFVEACVRSHTAGGVWMDV